MPVYDNRALPSLGPFPVSHYNVMIWLQNDWLLQRQDRLTEDMVEFLNQPRDPKFKSFSKEREWDSRSTYRTVLSFVFRSILKASYICLAGTESRMNDEHYKSLRVLFAGTLPVLQNSIKHSVTIFQFHNMEPIGARKANLGSELQKAQVTVGLFFRFLDSSQPVEQKKETKS